MVAQVADAWGKAKPQHVARPEHLIREAGGIRVMLLYPKVRVVAEESIQNVQRIAHGGVDHFRVERAVLIRHMGIERDRWIAPILGIDRGGRRTAS